MIIWCVFRKRLRCNPPCLFLIPKLVCRVYFFLLLPLFLVVATLFGDLYHIIKETIWGKKGYPHTSPHFSWSSLVSWKNLFIYLNFEYKKIKKKFKWSLNFVELQSLLLILFNLNCVMKQALNILSHIYITFSPVPILMSLCFNKYWISDQNA